MNPTQPSSSQLTPETGEGFSLPIADDFSLRPNGDNYIDQKDETLRIVNRIERSSSSVVGITGVRGAGKSSLAKKVLKACDALGYFTLLIPSPTGYEPREFLLAIFQRIGEHTADRLRQVVEAQEDLESVGKRKTQELRWLSRTIIFGLFIFFGVALGSFSYYLVSTKQERISDEITAETNELNSTNTRITEMEKRPIPASKDEADLSSHQLMQLQQHKDMLTKNIHDLFDEKTNFVLNSGVWSLIMAVVFGVLFYPVFIISGVYLFRLRRRINTYRLQSKRVGLYYEALALLDNLKYQSTLSSGREYGISLKGITGKATASRQLAERPLSLPGLTAVCTEFLTKISEVFSDKAVICIDELDKVTSNEQLLELLKGIKGLLGHEHSHFLLTISEDAMSLFNERLSTERNLVESAFEDIIYLERLSRDIASQLILNSPSLQGATASETTYRNCSILWAFGGGIPREIKRNTFFCRQSGIDITSSNPYNVWKMMYLELTNSMLAVSSPKEPNTHEAQYRFLILCEQMMGLANQSYYADVTGATAAADLIILSATNYVQAFCENCTDADIQRSENSENIANNQKAVINRAPIPYLPQLGELILGLVVLTFSGKQKYPLLEQGMTELDSLIYVYKYLPINARYAIYALQQFLQTRLLSLSIPSEMVTILERLTALGPKAVPVPASGIDAFVEEAAE
jgi:hypothetical protein